MYQTPSPKLDPSTVESAKSLEAVHQSAKSTQVEDALLSTKTGQTDSRLCTFLLTKMGCKRHASCSNRSSSIVDGNEAASTEIGNIIEKTQNQSGTWLKSIFSFVGVLIGASFDVALLSTANRDHQQRMARIARE